MNPEKSTIDQLRIDRRGPEERSSLTWVWVVLVILLLLAGLFLGWRFMRPAGAQVRTLTVREGAAGGGHERTVLNASGYVTARRQATVSSKVTGKVVEVLLEEGMKVKEGQVVARLDASNTDANVKLAEAQWISAQAARAETEARLEIAQLELKRTQDLAREKIASQSQLDAAEAEAKSLRARLDRLGKEVVVAERQLDLWRQELEDRIIRAPFSGIVVAKNAQPGEMISPISAGGGFTRTGIGTIVDMTSLEIEVDVNESFINRVEPNQRVAATLDAYPDWQIPAKVIAIIPAADRQKATVKVRIGFDQLDPRILPDMGVKVAFHDLETNKERLSALAIPSTAIRRENGRDIVLVVSSGRVERRAVTLGPARNDQVIVMAGLSAGEQIIVEGTNSLADGDRVLEKKQ